MQHNYVNVLSISVYMHHNYFDMRQKYIKMRDSNIIMHIDYAACLHEILSRMFDIEHNYVAW